MPENLFTLNTEQKEQIFENMSDGIMTVDSDGNITYMNSSCEKLFDTSLSSLYGCSFEEHFLSNRKNKSFNRICFASLHKNAIPRRTNVRYIQDGKTQYFNIDISLIHQDGNGTQGFPGMVLLFQDVTARHHLRQHEHDCAFIFAGLIICISLYLSLWSLLRFTLQLPITNASLTVMIECMTFLLFVEILLFTSLSMKDIGLMPNLSRLRQNLTETFVLAAIVCLLLVLAKLLLMFVNAPVKSYFIGGSAYGAFTYFFTSLIQEFLARGVIQTSVGSMMKVKYQKQFGVLLTSLLFALMHLPFGFIFLVSALALSLILGYLYERQGDFWGCVFLHWSCGYLAMCLFY